jgi:hypothetical protein
MREAGAPSTGGLLLRVASRVPAPPGVHMVAPPEFSRTT